jgi:hypothetical protein
LIIFTDIFAGVQLTAGISEERKCRPLPQTFKIAILKDSKAFGKGAPGAPGTEEGWDDEFQAHEEG